MLQWKIHTNRYGTFGRERGTRMLLKRILEWFFFICFIFGVCFPAAADDCCCCCCFCEIGKARDYVRVGSTIAQGN